MKIVELLKIVLLSNYYIRIYKYRRAFKIDNKTKLNNCYIGVNNKKNITFDNNIIGEKISSGENPVIIQLRHNAFLAFKENAFLRGGVKIQLEGNSKCIIGKNTYFNPNSTISGGGKAKISVGNNCAIAWNVNLIAYDFHAIEIIGGLNSSDYYGDIIIEDNVWIGANVTILKKTHIGSNTVVAANSVVLSGEYPDNSMLAGNPAKVIKTNINWRNLTKSEKRGL